MSFWQYQVQQEHSFQQSVLRNINEKCAHLQKELDSAVREARGQISLLNSKVSDLEREAELERRKVTTSQESLRERDKEYQRLKTQYDRLKRRVLLSPSNGGQGPGLGTNPTEVNPVGVSSKGQGIPSFGPTSNVPINVGAVVGDMDANGIQRTPITSRISQHNNGWRGSNQNQPRQAFNPQRQPFNAGFADRSFRSTTVSEQSENEVENMLGNTLSRHGGRPISGHTDGWTTSNNIHQGRTVRGLRYLQFSASEFETANVALLNG
ncbi:hypothetical protein NLI96_g1526 [Meripilus lineatus]|uniref:Uncharacterized protein n=1 Tax=Meripilus lineatus TaxID=2056292 RepID=A0AAD5YMU9_9APHY|nr:hypothetical protein NLI96_g1526 [Physisporinus lineatus]